MIRFECSAKTEVWGDEQPYSCRECKVFWDNVYLFSEYAQTDEQAIKDAEYILARRVLLKMRTVHHALVPR